MKGLLYQTELYLDMLRKVAPAITANYREDFCKYTRTHERWEAYLSATGSDGEDFNLRPPA
jgi:hypothetical protein